MASAAASSVAAEVNPSAQSLWEGAKASMSTATSARIKGNATQSGTMTTVDIAGTRDGSNSKAIVSQNGWTAEILSVSDGQYIKGDTAYWKMAGLTDAMIATIGTRYIKTDQVPTEDMAVGAFLEALQPVSFNLIDVLTMKVAKGDLGGVPVYVLTESGAINVTALVSADDNTYLLKLTIVGGDNPADLTFSEWNAVAPIEAPPADQVFNA